MDFGPGLDESLLGARQIAANALDRIEREHALGILIGRMKGRPVVRGADFHEHSKDDSEESRDLRHRLSPDLLVSRCRANVRAEPRRGIERLRADGSSAMLDRRSDFWISEFVVVFCEAWC